MQLKWHFTDVARGRFPQGVEVKGRELHSPESPVTLATQTCVRTPVAGQEAEMLGDASDVPRQVFTLSRTTVYLNVAVRGSWEALSWSSDISSATVLKLLP